MPDIGLLANLSLCILKTVGDIKPVVILVFQITSDPNVVF